MTLVFNLIPTICEPPKLSWEAEPLTQHRANSRLVKRPEADVDQVYGKEMGARADLSRWT